MRRPLTATISLVKSLSHQIRTPLSVIQNEITYFKGLLPEGETDRALAKCAAITQILKNLNIVSLSGDERVKVPLYRLIDGLLSGGEIAAYANEPRIKAAFSGFLKLIESLGAQAQVSAEEEGEVLIKISVTGLLLRKAEAGKSYGSFSSFFLEQIESDTFVPALLDPVFWADGFQTGVLVDESRVIFLVRQPVSDE